MQRAIALIILVLGLVVPIFFPSPVPSKPATGALSLAAEPIADPQRLAHDLGPLRLEKAWVLSGDAHLGGYSALIGLKGHRLLALSDAGDWLWLDMATGHPFHHAAGSVHFARRHLHKTFKSNKALRDVESAVRDAATGRIWVGLEGYNGIARLTPQLFEESRVAPTAMHRWGENTGPEAMARLPDGRFIVLRESTRAGSKGRQHDGVLFAGDPTRGASSVPFTFEGPRNFSVVDMAQLPDGRMLLLMRRLIWPMPLRFAGRIVIADPSAIREGAVWKSQEIAVLASDLPIDNFEGIAVTQSQDGRDTVWLISDDNFMKSMQRTLLWQLSVDPAALPWPEGSAPSSRSGTTKGAQGNPARPVSSSPRMGG